MSCISLTFCTNLPITLLNVDKQYLQVQFSMLEIYNENVFDLLSGKERKALKIRQSKQRGFFGECKCSSLY